MDSKFDNFLANLDETWKNSYHQEPNPLHWALLSEEQFKTIEIAFDSTVGKLEDLIDEQKQDIDALNNELLKYQKLIKTLKEIAQQVKELET